MKRNQAWNFARAEMVEEGEILHRAEGVGPFVVALVELSEGGYQNRVAQPDTIYRGRNSRVPDVTVISTHGANRYGEGARRFNSLVDNELR